MNIRNRLLCLLISLIQISCNTQSLDYVKEIKYGELHYCDSDAGIINDLVKTTESSLPKISGEQNITLSNHVTVEIYPDQEEYNNSVMNPELKGSPAISGNGKIQMVSPSAKIKIDMKYEDRLMLLVHEYVHILIDNLDKAPPVFIDEGIACFYSSYDFYSSSAKKYIKQINFIPEIKQLQEHYNDIPAPDLFSFIFIDFIVQVKGREMLPEILRQPGDLVNEELNNTWKKYIKQSYY